MKRIIGIIPPSVLMPLAGPAVMVLTRPSEPIPQTITKSVTRRNIKRIEDVVPLTPEKRKINIQGK